MTDTTSVDGPVSGSDGRARCRWCVGDDLYMRYHDLEWGMPIRDDRSLFEKLCLEGFQAGLSWLTILRKRDRFREVFARFDPEVVARFDRDDIDRLLADPGIVRNRAKIQATIQNARAFLDLVADQGSFADHVWAYAPTEPPVPHHQSDLRATSPESVALSRDLKGRGFAFVGPTTVYAFQQAMGMVDDHLVGCWRRGAGTVRPAPP